MMRRGRAAVLLLSLLLPASVLAAPSLDLARGLVEAEQFDQAVEVLKTVEITDGPTAARVDLLLGRIYLSLGKPGKALDHFEHASFAAIETEAESYLGLAEARLALGDLAHARRNAQMALKVDADQVAAHLVLARADLRVGQGAEAMARLRRLRADRPESEDVALVLARYLAQSEGPNAALAELRTFIAIHPTAAGALDLQGQVLWGTGRKAEAIQARQVAAEYYRQRGQTGRADAMTAWLKAVEPSRPAAPAIVEPPRPEPVPPKPVEAAPLPPPEPRPVQVVPIRKTAPASVLPSPEPLPFAPGSAINTGSGIVLEGGRQIVTNRHVVEGMTTIAVRNGTGHVRTARVVRMSSDDDLALLEIERPFPEGAVMPFADIVDPAPGRAAIVMGFPLIGLLGDEQPALTEGIVAKTMGLGNDPSTFQMTTKINKGNSGGPVFDKRGRLIGITVGKMDSAQASRASATPVEDMNIAIKASRLTRFLGKSNTGTGGEGAAEMNLEDLYQVMLPRAVLVAAQK
ncbi:serine protease [Magnetospirillum sp. ME-1]|uniref:S1 family peptidase n=1 Tax=Magnetospirillum sp. ME-1 TaxID=1639348 RepID=UPI000A17A27D|nr:serine protease [Magnetospirillum sp. ME-1]ARJ65917.1 serine protease [Magnetospirillum sp. ME-1]